MVGKHVRGGSGGIQAMEMNVIRFGVLFWYNCGKVNKHLSELYKELYVTCDLVCRDSSRHGCLDIDAFRISEAKK